MNTSAAPMKPRSSHMGRLYMNRLRAAGLALVLVLIAATGLAAYVMQATPATQGVVYLNGMRAGIAAAVEIERDAWGIPTIRAQSMQDAAFGLGFVHAQDRLWQLEVHRRSALGQLSEVFGPSAVGQDKLQRTLGIPEVAAAQWRAAPDALAGVTRAYAAGINAYVQDQMRARPPEFIALSVQPGTWEPQHSLAWLITLAWQLSGNGSAEMERMALGRQLTHQQLQSLLPGPGSDLSSLYRSLLGPLPEAMMPGQTNSPRPRDASGGASVRGVLGPVAGSPATAGIGSNAWVVAGSHSETGKPLLANDPHLALSAPSLWYLARIETPDVKVAGATIPGLPVIVIGQNEHVAWGLTASFADQQDLYLEQFNPSKPDWYLGSAPCDLHEIKDRQIRQPAQPHKQPQWQAFDSRNEVIRVRGSDDIRFVARSTCHGPVMFDEDASGVSPLKGHVLALRWAALDPDPSTLASLMAFASARNVSEIAAAARGFVSPAMNVIMADRQGHVGITLAGRVPLRRIDNDLQGLAPGPGWDPRYDWQGYLPVEQLPSEFDPARGWLVNANLPTRREDMASAVFADPPPPYRQQRIEQLITARSQHGVESLRAMQADIDSLPARALLGLLRQARSTHPVAPQALALLRGFDGAMSADQGAPAIYKAWMRELLSRRAADLYGDAALMVNPARLLPALLADVANKGATWCGQDAAQCRQRVDKAMDAALAQLQQSQGPEPARWRWGRAHQVVSTHTPFSYVPVLSHGFELSAAAPGETDTVNAMAAEPQPDGSFIARVGPSLRVIFDLADAHRSRIVLPTGQSGLPWSAAYRNMTNAWLSTQDVALWPSPSAPSEPGARLTLLPPQPLVR